jgi:hypothetical protein
MMVLSGQGRKGRAKRRGRDTRLEAVIVRIALRQILSSCGANAPMRFAQSVVRRRIHRTVAVGMAGPVWPHAHNML